METKERGDDVPHPGRALFNSRPRGATQHAADGSSVSRGVWHWNFKMPMAGGSRRRKWHGTESTARMTRRGASGSGGGQAHTTCNRRPWQLGHYSTAEVHEMRGCRREGYMRAWEGEGEGDRKGECGGGRGGGGVAQIANGRRGCNGELNGRFAHSVIHRKSIAIWVKRACDPQRDIRWNLEEARAWGLVRKGVARLDV